MEPWFHSCVEILDVKYNFVLKYLSLDSLVWPHEHVIILQMALFPRHKSTTNF